MSKKNRNIALAGSGIIGLAGLAYTAWHVAGLTQVVMTVGSTPVDGAIEYLNYAVDGVMYTLSVIPAAIGFKILIAGIMVACIAYISYKTYKIIKLSLDQKKLTLVKPQTA